MTATSARFSVAPTTSLLGFVLATLVVACGGSGAAPSKSAESVPSASAPSKAPGADPVAAARGETAKAAPESAEAPPSPPSPPSFPAPSSATREVPRGTTVLHIGDSFAGALGIDLNVELKAAGVRGILRYETATYIPTWAFGKQIDKYLGQFNPDLVLVTLGANELEIQNPADRIPTIHRLVGRLGGRPCVWVGPPLWKGARPALLDTIQSACAPCLYLDSNAIVPDLERARDHIHPSIDARKTWAKAVLDWLLAHRAKAGARPWDLTL